MPPETRWVPRVQELIQSFVFRLHPLESTSYLYKPAVRTVLGRYQSRLAQPFANDPQSFTKSRVFANNYLNMGDVKVVGFDLDYTLVPYTVELQTLIYNLARDILTSAYAFPSEFKSCTFDPQFAIRGLSVDARFGVLIKLNHLQRVGHRYAYKGKRPITSQEMEEYYGSSRHLPYNELIQLRALNDMFSLAEACLIADAMEIFEHRKKQMSELYSPTALIDDIQAAVREVHVSGMMHNAVIADLDRFVNSNDQLPELLHLYKVGGKKLFLCTNSGYHYTDKTLSYAIGHKMDWKELFDVVICSAQKPDWFKTKKPFRMWNIADNRPSITPVGQLSKGQVYVGGSCAALERATGWKGRDVLFIGDNLRADLVDARRWHGWKTACIINELDREIDVQDSPWYHELHYLRSTLRQLIGDLQLAMHHQTFPEVKSSSADVEAVTGQGDNQQRTKSSTSNSGSVGGVGSTSGFSMEDAELLQTLEVELQRVNVELSSLFNCQFGSIFRTDGHPSLFAFAVRRYTDMYLAEVCDLMYYNPSHHFYPQHALHMAHDPVYNEEFD
jgi:HAD superfamily 5'-nucleotidase-like hydrolase